MSPFWKRSRKYRRAAVGVVPLIAAALIMVFGDAVRDLFSVIVFILCLGATWRFKLNPFYLLIIVAVVGMLLG